MDNEMLTQDAFIYIVERIIDNAKDAVEEGKANNTDFYKGLKTAYYEVLDTIKNELTCRDADIEKYGLDFELESIA